ncbi:similar to Saccharomyces cerevisiae YER147C SCC4 Subunit of cohesin loading factor (Scc2p-Scc4p), a complex required for the loading of cohesin complexes onto chromosomes [Maudiozyma saulgeensis]|uniref:Similar to Saccharomyces cerevisiae YER147C SCC4 Subunit of cohesin loading factor (Scc2p-Scc4p), a complex required for the loading of cohesin complexes onto chromosomes n=1 Tax=Maudiozyma saulgeensis TaxID=1789683 RepID=A0A1X7R7P2_9SACH|nr:similar to Saccharomyces cerevisiae YER147C SCC4 Subunit of cohesin loading factor (Scc2p-Scc4p), a complex required for the loading of cohesin complexes onto chromosomes [Kazachstania saulgeensis]
MASVVELLQISKECTDQAHRFGGIVNDQNSLEQYYTLIRTSIQALVDIKTKYSLSIVQDVYVTFSLTKLLLDETTDCEIAETYLSSLRQRLQNYKNGSDYIYMQYWLQVEFIALYDVTMKRNSKFQYRVALNNCTSLITYLKSLFNEDNTALREWCQLFQLVEVLLCDALNRTKKVNELYPSLLTESKQINEKWHMLVVTYYINWLLERHQQIPKEYIEELYDATVETLGPQLYVMKLMLLLTDSILKDENITDILTQFKAFFEKYKDQLNDQSVITISFSQDVDIVFKHSTLFQYKNLKTLLLFFQAVSYLVNCYDETANFSIKFLPRVKKNLVKELHSRDKTGSNPTSISLNDRDYRLEWYSRLLDLADFYRIWERLILKSHISEKDLREGSHYSDLLKIMHNHENLQSEDIADQYYNLSQRTMSNEVELLSLLNCYIILISKINGCEDNTKQTLMVRCEKVWHDVEILQDSSNISKNNTMWDCTIVIIWLISHLEPFTWTPLPTNDETRSKYLTRLQKYYNSNRLTSVSDDKQNEVETDYKMKKSLFLQVMVNYLGGRLLETNLEKINEISNICLQITKGQRMPYIRYVIGLWHLMNCTISMNSKEVLIAKAKIESILKEM